MHFKAVSGNGDRLEVTQTQEVATIITCSIQGIFPHVGTTPGITTASHIKSEFQWQEGRRVWKMGGVFFGTQNSKCQVLITFSFSGEGGILGFWPNFHFWIGCVSGKCILGYLKLKVPSSDKFFIFGGRGWGEWRSDGGGELCQE